jgi:putative DNA methylase
VASRAAVYGALVPAPADKKAAKEAQDFVDDLCKYNVSKRAVEEAQKHILEAHAQRLSEEQGRLVTAEDIEAGRAPRPRVLDMFAGGGAIPLEALRLGCESYALDLNPVAHIIQLCTLVYPQQYGRPDPAAKGSAPDGTWAGLADEVEHWGRWVIERVRQEIGDLYPPIPDPRQRSSGEGSQMSMNLAVKESQASYDAQAQMLTPVAYLWTRTVRCKNPKCGGIVPLARQTWLATKHSQVVALRPLLKTDSDPPRVVYSVVQARTKAALGFDPVTKNRAGNIPCPFCGTVADSGYVKQQGLSGNIATQAMATISIREGTPGKVYFAAEELPEDFQIDDKVLERRLETLCSETGLTMPFEPLYNDAKGSAWCVMYGLDRFEKLFTTRQLIALLTFVKYVRRAHEELVASGYSEPMSRVVTSYLGLAVSRLSNFCSSLCTWFHSGGRGVKHVFARQALPMVWDFAETNPLNDKAASWPVCIDAVVENVRLLTVNKMRSAEVSRGTALHPPYPSGHFDAIITDPPYYDNVPYSNLSDFFYVWLQRAIGFLYPEHFAGQSTPKKSEIVADATRHGADRDKAKIAYETMMEESFRAANNLLKADSILVVVYAHKTTAGWTTLVDALRASGFMITEAWPLETENVSRLRAMDSASLASSIFLVARRRHTKSTGSYENEVLPKLREVVRERVERLWAQGVTGADLVIACVGAGLQAFTRFARVEYANGQEVPADSFLTEVEGAVLEGLLAKIFGVSQAGVSSVDATTRFYVLWRYAYRHASIEAGEAIIFAYPQQVELDGPRGLTSSSNPLAEKKSSKYRLRDFSERGSDEELGLPRAGAEVPLIDVLHRLLYLVEHHPAGIPAYLDQAQPDVERLRVVAQTLAGQALAGNGSGGGKSLIAARGAEAAALKKLTANWRSLIEGHRGSLV